MRGVSRLSLAERVNKIAYVYGGYKIKEKPAGLGADFSNTDNITIGFFIVAVISRRKANNV